MNTTKRLLNVFLMATIITIALASAAWCRVAPLNPAFEEFILEQQTGRKAGDMTYGARIPSPVDLSHLAGVHLFPDIQSNKAVTSFPVSFDLRTQGFVTPVRNQEPYGTCWAFSALGSLESTALKAGVPDPDYSEQYLAYFGSVNQTSTLVGFGNHDPEDFPRFMNFGGDDFQAIALLARGTGAVPERAAPYGRIPAADTPASWSLRHAYNFYFNYEKINGVNTRFQKANEANIKEALMTYGAVSVGMFANDPQGGKWESSPYFNPETFASYTPPRNSDGLTVGRANHGVTVVGWDDTYPRTRFNLANQPSSNGAWIVKNSWGPDWGDRGYFYLSYEDTVMDTGVAYVGDKPRQFNTIYQYDPLGWCNSYTPAPNENESAWMANIFTAATDFDLKAVSFYTGGIGTTYSLSVYTGVMSSPTSGRISLQAQTGTLQMPGYHTVELDREVRVPAGETFSVVVHLTTPGYGYPIALETRVRGYSDKASSSKGQGYASLDGTTWTDITSEAPGASICLKALGNHVGSSAPGSITVTLWPPEAVNDGAKWSLDGGKTWNKSGTTVRGLSPGQYTVTVTDLFFWKKEEPQTVTVVTGRETSLKMTYEGALPFIGSGGCSVGFSPWILVMGMPFLFFKKP